MDFIKQPVKGMPEQLPQVMELREYALNTIKSVYKKFGFSLIETPAVEHIENLSNKQGGENEQLIFKILKRGEKLKKAENIDELVDSGLRYDLTVPLARFYANNIAVLPSPFKAMQIGPVWRADRPQKGRFRQFVQCDIDIIGDKTSLAEIELINATTTALSLLKMPNCIVKVNDRQLLKALALSAGFLEEQLGTVFIALDKLDKIGKDGVRRELLSFEIDPKVIDQYLSFFNDEGAQHSSCVEFLNNINQDLSISEEANNLEQILSTLKSILNQNIKVVYDPTLVRGMGYYTGPIFEIYNSDLNMAVAGGGRYDKMIGKYSGVDTPACGFSIGFERIIEVLKDTNFEVEDENEKIAYLISKDTPSQIIQAVFAKANALRQENKQVLLSPRNKNVKAQKDKLIEFGYTNIIDIFPDTSLDKI